MSQRKRRGDPELISYEPPNYDFWNLFKRVNKE